MSYDTAELVHEISGVCNCVLWSGKRPVVGIGSEVPRVCIARWEESKNYSSLCSKITDTHFVKLKFLSQNVLELDRVVLRH